MICLKGVADIGVARNVTSFIAKARRFDNDKVYLGLQRFVQLRFESFVCVRTVIDLAYDMKCWLLACTVNIKNSLIMTLIK